ncbi:aldo/keto reductase [Nocardia macrotermitis]|uniref:Putative oxidoreductase n=1 Tax=Nocardia macrotermitis TaxID=2585198 RepID=A0A7K0DEZ1_9NOCA|nr:aldo/keto reductase [Nocardia macrotermitis]MQY24209.1 putative oxidoreductase [Nocardia macrotermitis]
MITMRRLGSTDLEITPIGLGCMQFAGQGIVTQFYRPLDQDTIGSIVRAAHQGGVNWFDTAEMYGRGHSERALTSALTSIGVTPGQVRVSTKWAPLGRTAANIGRTIDARLTALQGFPIDLYQIHEPHGSLSSITRQVRAMAELRTAGKIAAVGVSNFSARQMELADEILRAHGLRLASNQVQISLLHRAIEHNGVLETARRLGVTLIAFSPLRSGLLTGKFHATPELMRTVRPIRRTLGGFSARTLTRTAPLIDELRAIADAYGAVPAQVALAWLLTHYSETVVAIPGASSPTQATASSEAMNLHLTDAELDRLDTLSAAQH